MALSCNTKRGGLGALAGFVLTGSPGGAILGGLAGLYSCPGAEFPVVGIKKPFK